MSQEVEIDITTSAEAPSHPYSASPHHHCDHSCRCCHDHSLFGFIRRHDDCVECKTARNRRMNVTNLITLVFLALEWLLGIITFGVEVGYEVCSLFIRYYSYHYLERNAREYLVRTRLVYTTVTAFPLIVLPIICLPIFFSKRSMPSSMYIMLGLIGCGCYIATGAVTLASANLTWVPLGATQAFGALAITTGIVYLAHCAYEILRGKDDEVD